MKSLEMKLHNEKIYFSGEVNMRKRWKFGTTKMSWKNAINFCFWSKPNFAAAMYSAWNKGDADFKNFVCKVFIQQTFVILFNMINATNFLSKPKKYLKSTRLLFCVYLRLWMQRRLPGSFPDIADFDGGIEFVGKGFSGLVFKSTLDGVPVVLKARSRARLRSDWTACVLFVRSKRQVPFMRSEEKKRTWGGPSAQNRLKFLEIFL